MTLQNKLTLTGIALALVLFICGMTNIFGLLHNSMSSLDVSLWTSRFEFWIALTILYFYSSKIEKTTFLLWVEQKKKPLFYLSSVVIILIGVTVTLTAISIAEKKLGLIESNNVLTKITDVLCGDKLLLVFTF